MSARLIAAVLLAAALLGSSVARGDTAPLNKREARAFLMRAFPPAAPRALLREERAKFYSTERLSLARAPRCAA